MNRAKQMEGFQLLAQDGDIGRVEDFLFDDNGKAVRFLVVNTGFWLFGRKVLISPHAVRGLDTISAEIRVNLTREQVRGSPDIDTEMPVSRQHEMELLRYYNWPAYWGGLGLWRDADRPQLYPLEYISQEPGEGHAPAPFLLSPEGSELNPHLRSVRELRRYKVDARGETAGQVEDVIIEEKTWALRYLVVDTLLWWPSLPVALPTDWITSFTWEKSLIHVDVDRELIKSAPELSTSVPIDRGYEQALYRHYGRKGYWERKAA